ncbi:MAG: hypothetical protein HOV73_01740 [Streptomyces sp.]|nr:hypothetical protein [Streptomyces sp.]
MSRDMTSEEWAEELIGKRRLYLEQFERKVSYVRRQAYYEGLTHHLRPGMQGTPLYECPFCSAEETDLHTHLITCEEVPLHLRVEPTRE